MRSLSPRRPARRQFAFAGALTAALLIALSAVGGVSYAANAVSRAADAVAKVVTPKAHHGVVVVAGLNAGGDQYRPGFGFGDPNHNHSGPPGLNKSGAKLPPAQVSNIGKAVIVKTSITSDEQAALYFSVLDPSGNELLLTQKGSTVGAGVTGPQAKSIHYVMLVPRTIPVQLRIPANLLISGKTYTIRVIAVDAQGNKSETNIKFTAP